MRTYSEEKTPAYTHNCTKCRFLFSVTDSGRAIDVYEACNGSNSPYIVRCSDEPSDYATVELRHLFHSWAITHIAEWAE